MRLGMHSPTQNGASGDPRDNESAEAIDLASRNGFPAVVDRKAKGDGLGLAAGFVIVGLLGATTFWAMQAAQIDDTALPEEPAEPVVPAAAPPPAVIAAPAPQEVQPDPAPAPVLARDPNANRVPAVNPYASPTLVYDASNAAASNRVIEAPEAGPATAGNSSANVGGLSAAAAFANRIGGVGGAPAQATPLTNPSTTVTQGTLIPAVLETAINTDVPGFVRAVVSQDVRSFDGTRVLVPRSSRLIGQYQSGVQNGQKRAYVIWQRLIRPDGVSVNIQSPAVAFDGTTGLEGDVNTHFFRRFGSAMLLSVIGGLTAAASSGAAVVVGGAGQSAASTALQQDGNIPPTIRVKMGEPIRVFTARDLDFSSVE